MTLRLTKRERTKLTRIVNKLYREGVEDEHKAAAFYGRMAEELHKVRLYKESIYLANIAESEKLHKDILNEIIQDIKEKIIMSQFKKEITLKGNKSLIGKLGK